MFNIGLPELIVLIVIGVIFFGPEKLPEIARKAARVVKYLQGVANDAKGVLAEHVGPEFADLELQDLTPQKLAQKYLGEAMREIEEVKSDLAGVRSELDTVAGQANAAITPATPDYRQPVTPVAVIKPRPPRTPTVTAKIRKVKAANRRNKFPQRRNRR